MTIKLTGQNHNIVDFENRRNIRDLNDYFARSILLVYGTLMAGEKEHYILGMNKCLGKAEAAGFDMYDTGFYPVIVPGNGTIKGELYEITGLELERIDLLKGAGNKFNRQSVPAVNEQGDTVLVHLYVYNKDTSNLEHIPEQLQPYTANWKDKLRDYVWYVSYGSNMLKARFLCYIRGGSFENSSKIHEPCSDTSDPIAIEAAELPHDMYFGNKSGSWDKKGVSFLDITKPGHALGVAYLITHEQLEHVARQENGGKEPENCPNWYNTIKKLGTHERCDVVTITNDGVRPYNEPSEKYLDTLSRGLVENFPGMTKEEIRQYLLKCIRK